MVDGVVVVVDVVVKLGFRSKNTSIEERNSPLVTNGQNVPERKADTRPAPSTATFCFRRRRRKQVPLLSSSGSLKVYL